MWYTWFGFSSSIHSFLSLYKMRPLSISTWHGAEEIKKEEREMKCDSIAALGSSPGSSMELFRVEFRALHVCAWGFLRVHTLNACNMVNDESNPRVNYCLTTDMRESHSKALYLSQKIIFFKNRLHFSLLGNCSLLYKHSCLIFFYHFLFSVLLST